MNSEAKVGLFVFIGFVLLFALSTQVGSFKNLSKEGYLVQTNLINAAGLNENSKVKANGLEIGYIKSLKINGNGVLADLFIYEHVMIPNDSTIKPIQESLLGGRYLEITLGQSDTNYHSNDMISAGKESLGIQDASDAMAHAANEFETFISEFREVMNGETRESLRITFSNLEQITSELKKLTSLDLLKNTITNFDQMAQNLSSVGEKFSHTADTVNANLPTILANLDILVKDLKMASANIREKMPKLADKFVKIGSDLENVIAQNKTPLNNSLTSANSFFSSGTDTFGKIEDLIATVDKVKLEVAMHSEYMSDDSYNKGYLALNYLPSDTKQYRFAVSGMDDYSRMDDTGALVEPKKHESSNILISAQIAKRIDDTVLRTGIIENTFGAGFDYFMLHDQLEASAEVYDFNAENDVRGEKPHMKISARYNILKHLDLYGGYDNILNDESKNAFIGVGVRFFDNDLKTLIMSQSLGAYAN